MKSKYIIEVVLSIGLHGEQSDELDLCLESDKTEAELDALPSEELEEFMHEVWKDWAWNHIEGGATLLQRTN
jgi:hypothetical protein